jgi:hypothetical protein
VSGAEVAKHTRPHPEELVFASAKTSVCVPSMNDSLEVEVLYPA